MEPKYIFAIVALSLFVVLFLIFFVLLAHRRKKEARLQAWLHEVYSDRNLIKMDYDSAEEDETEQAEAAVAPETVQETEKPAQAETEKTATEPEPEKEEEKQSSKIPEDIYGKIEIEGIEEITGNYNPKQ